MSEMTTLTAEMLKPSVQYQRKTARKTHQCRHCLNEIQKGEPYYCIYYGNGLGSLKFPHRVHLDCLEPFKQVHPEYWWISLDRVPTKKPIEWPSNQILFPCKRCIGGQVLGDRVCIQCGAEHDIDDNLITSKLEYSDLRQEARGGHH